MFRSMSLSGRKQSNKEQTASDDKRNSTISISETEKVTILMDHNAQLLDEKNRAVDECDQMNKDLQDANNKLKDAEREIENLKELLSARIKREFDNCEADANEKRTRISFSDLELEPVESKGSNVIFPSKVEHLETTIEANAVPLQKTTSCKECERLKESRIKAFVEAIALRKYVKNLNDALSGGEASKQNFLNDVQKKLISAQTEKEVALEELATVIDQRNQAVQEKDKALEEWGKATSKWETTLDQLDSLVKELNKVRFKPRMCARGTRVSRRACVMDNCCALSPCEHSSFYRCKRVFAANKEVTVWRLACSLFFSSFSFHILLVNYIIMLNMKLLIKSNSVTCRNMFYLNNFFSPVNSSVIIVCYINKSLQKQLKLKNIKNGYFVVEKILNILR